MIPKFRVYDKENNCMLMLSECHVESVVGRLFLDLMGITHKCHAIDSGYVADKENYLFMQSTGLFDSTGTEMFEGDIVIIKGSDAMYFIRRFDDMSFGFGDVCSFDRKTNIGYDTYEHGFPMQGQMRIVGNCYQHPHLLEKTA